MPTAPLQADSIPQTMPAQARRRWLLGFLALSIVFICGFAVIVRNAYAAQYAQDARNANNARQANERRYANEARNARAARNPIANAVRMTTETQRFANSSTPPISYVPTAYATQANPFIATPIPAQPTEPAERALAAEISKLVASLRTASSEAKTELKKSLQEAVGKLFDLRHAAQAKQVESLEAELAEAKELHKKRGARKVEIIERRIAELLESADDLAWNRELAAQSPPQLYYTTPMHTNENNPAASYGALLSTLPRTSVVPNNDTPPPLSSTPPSFIPLTTPPNGVTSNPGSIPPLDPAPVISSPLPATRSAEPIGTKDPLPLNPASLPAGNISSSRAIIDAAYAYEEALSDAIENRKLASKGVASSREVVAAERIAAKAKDTWKILMSDFHSKFRLTLRELEVQRDLEKTNLSVQQKAEVAIAIERLTADIESLRSSGDWATEFESKKLSQLQKAYEAGQDKKVEESVTSDPSK